MKTISCIICAYNEIGRIEHILAAVTNHPLLTEIIVVNDGSTDATEAFLRMKPHVRTISYFPNRGKTYALGAGIKASTGDLVLLLDADLAGIRPEDITALLTPVLEGRADVAISLRRNSLGIYRLLGLDFVSGERVIPQSLAQELMEKSAVLPRWGGEVYMNELIVKHRLRVAVVRWSTVFNIRKYEKVGRRAGLKEEFRMMRDALSVLSPFATVRQHVQLLLLKEHVPSSLMNEKRYPS